MKNKQQEFFHTTQTTEDFLLYKTDEKPPEVPGKSVPENSAEFFSLHFPGVQSGKAFVDSALAQLSQSPRFGVMGVKLDDHPESGSLPEPEELLKFLNLLSSFCQRENGLWGQLEPTLFICFLPDKNAEDTRTIATEFQKALLEISSQTLTLGIAAFPFMEYQRKDMVENALKALDHAFFFGAGAVVAFDAVSLNISGDHYYQRGNIEAAIAEFKSALKMDAGNVNVLNSMGVCFAVMGDFSAALDYFKAAGKEDPLEVMAWYNTALVYKLKGDKQKALKYFLKTDAIQNDVFEVVFQTGKIYFEMGDQDTGKKYYARALDLAMETPAPSRFIGDCYAGLGVRDQAVKAYQKAIKENPNDAHALSALGALYDTQGENPEIAAVFCRQSVDIAPGNSLFRRRLGLLHLKQNRFNEALKEFKTADNLDQSDAEPIPGKKERKPKSINGRGEKNPKKPKKKSPVKSAVHG
ncbi:MAG: tetratricopeptide repeat protein [Proteobacteria bacterium]|nr:tetratricopeptide repeat protein [Pseudomonadota bacterium]MBU4471775.1 tetratricopeptide repeat protein [Pseudomonadota bacterium]MCG2750556.1 tetratricopeptide repeat protein [Desulfobacteraceae bacterium]